MYSQWKRKQEEQKRKTKNQQTLNSKDVNTVKVASHATCWAATVFELFANSLRIFARDFLQNIRFRIFSYFVSVSTCCLLFFS